MGGLCSRMKTIKPRFVYPLTIVLWFFATGCTNIDLLSKLEAPGGGASFRNIRVVSTNIDPSLNTGGTFNATVTFSEAVNVPIGSITIDNGAALTSLASVDNITWTFTLSGLTNATYNVQFSSNINAVSGGSLVPFTVTFTHTGV